MKRLASFAPLAAVLLAAAGCQSGGADGVLASAAKEGEGRAAYAPKPGTKTSYKGVKGENPNDPGRLRNTRTALTGYCPGVRIREGTGVYRIYPKGAEPDAAIKYQASIARTARECEYDGENLKMRVGVRGRIINGPSGATGAFAMPIRVAVVEGGRTVYSKLHRPKAEIAPGTSNAAFSYVDEEVVIPAPSKTNVRVYVGFDEGPPKKS